MSGLSIERLNAALEGRYRIEQELGQGGMATVYLAEDMRHRRKVAVKVLRPELAAVVGAERFLAEIETTANLQHPHILPLFDSGAEEGFLFYVMPYVEGESLRARLDREKQLPVDEAVRIAVEVAEALDHAHRHGVVHRDVKPANILLQDGRPVVADFGIALAVSAAGEGRLTETGLSLGTPYYMSPEQATGDRQVDARSDVYALSCVLYEMLTGEPPYTGTTAQAVLGRILMGEPARPTEIRKAIPPHVDAVVMRGLEKLPADRFASAAELARALREPEYGRAVAASRGIGGVGSGAAWWRSVAVAELAVGAVLVTALGWSLLNGGGEEPRIERQRVVLGSRVETIPGAVGLRTAIAPDGSGILFGDTVGLGLDGTAYFWKPTGEADAVRLPNLDDAVSVTFSPDGRWIAFVAGGELRKQPVRGGTAVTLVDSIGWGIAHALAWLEDGTIVFENTDYVMQRIADDGGGIAETVTTRDQVGYPIHASGLPGGGAFLVSGCTNTACSTSHLSLVDLVADTVVRLIDDVFRAWPIPGERIVYVDRRGSVMAASLDRARWAVGPAVPLFDGVRINPYYAEMQLGAGGSVLFVRGDVTTGDHEAVWVDRDGGTEPVDPEWGPGLLSGVALSPDGRHLAVSMGGGGGSRLWVKELPAGPLTRLTADESERPVWTRDGRSVAYVTQVTGEAHVLPADGSTQTPDTLLRLERPVWEVAFPEGGGILFREGAAGGGGTADLRFLPAGEESARDVLASEFDERAMSLSPDGSWLAYVSDSSGRDEVFARPFPESGARRVQVSTNGGTEPLWAHSGAEIFYRDGEGWMVAASVSTDPDFAVEARSRLFDARTFQTEVNWHAYDIALDDERFVMLSRVGTPSLTEGDLVLVESFFRELDAAGNDR